ncbi:unnamed protein product [Anisakis simplex]|uniref:MFS_1_like domain-containing protein n=1 Tax=Anisakis simplex TaxID=6269 RepID=A0A0M3JCI8_ANISI|nr:unnamed protein product [Anisakis simplex]
MESGERIVKLFGREYGREAFVSRLFYLCFFASFGSLFPLLGIYFKQLGMNAAQAGFLLGARPLVEFASSPFWGSFADRFKKVSSNSLISSQILISYYIPIR